MKKKIIDIIIILILALIVSIPLASKDLDIYVDDGIQHIARLMGTYQTIAEGEFPPVIMSNFCNQFGYSWNIFYSPLTAYAPIIFSWRNPVSLRARSNHNHKKQQSDWSF